MQDLIQKLEKATEGDARMWAAFVINAPHREWPRIKSMLVRQMLRARHSQPSDDKASDLANGAEPAP